MRSVCLWISVYYEDSMFFTDTQYIRRTSSADYVMHRPYTRGCESDGTEEHYRHMHTLALKGLPWSTSRASSPRSLLAEGESRSTYYGTPLPSLSLSGRFIPFPFWKLSPVSYIKFFKSRKFYHFLKKAKSCYLE